MYSYLRKVPVRYNAPHSSKMAHDQVRERTHCLTDGRQYLADDQDCDTKPVKDNAYNADYEFKVSIDHMPAKWMFVENSPS